MERRSIGRCPVCSGPAVEDKAMPDGIRCRRSICVHNHADVQCPRCQHKDLEAVDFKNDAFAYTCRECTHRWSIASKSSPTAPS